MKQTVLTGEHWKLGAKMAPFAGYIMPVEYSGVRDEHMTVRKRVGIFDVSHMGEIWVRGSGALELLLKIATNDASRLYPGKVQYSCLPNGKGGIVDDLLVYRFDQEEYLLVVNAANIEKDWNWISQHNSSGAVLEEASGEISMIALQGPAARDVLQPLTPAGLTELGNYTFIRTSVGGVEDVTVSVTGYTGAGGYELYFPNEAAVTVWNELLDAGSRHGIKPAGLAARDTLRLEMGYCLYGNDIDDYTSPIEAGLDWICKFSDNRDFIDKQYLYNQKTGGVKRRLCGFRLRERGIPRQHYRLYDEGLREIGYVTSGTMSPVLNTGIGMGYLDTYHATAGTRILVGIRNKMLPAEVVSLPFIN